MSQLLAYPNNDGALSFSWVQAKRGDSLFKGVTRTDVSKYLSEKKNAQYADWEVVYMCGYVRLLRPITRLTEAVLEVQGRMLRYRIEKDVLKVTTYSDLMGKMEDVYDTEILQAMNFYLNHEKEILKQRN